MRKRPKSPRSRASGSLVFISVALLCVAAFALLYTGGRLLAGDQPVAASSQPASAVPAASTSASSTPAPTPQVTTLHVSATGDNLIHDGLYLQARERAGGKGYDFTSLYQNIAPFYKNYDINWINQETLIADENVISPSSYPCFCTPSAMGHQLYDMGFRVISMANNHSYDKGAAGIAATRAFWAGMPSDVVTTGLFAGQADYDNIPMQSINGVNIAYLSYTYGTNGIPTPKGAVANVITTSQVDVIEHQVKLARHKADIVVVGVHWGTEGSHVVHETQRSLGQKLADWGADIIIGTHPHMVQAIDKFTDANTGKVVPVAYSLGNFVSTQLDADNLFGLILTFDITKTVQPDGSASASVSNVHGVPMVMYYDANFKNATAYLYKDYTDAIAATHRNHTLTRAYIEKVLKANISSEYLVLT